MRADYLCSSCDMVSKLCAVNITRPFKNDTFKCRTSMTVMGVAPRACGSM